MRGVYTATNKIPALNTNKTLLYLTASSGKMLELLSSSVTSASGTTSQQIECGWTRISGLGTASGTQITASPHELGDQLSTTVCVSNCSVEPSGYITNTDLGREGANALTGWYYDPLPEERIPIAPNQSIGLRMYTSTLTAFDCQVRTTFREIG